MVCQHNHDHTGHPVLFWNNVAGLTLIHRIYSQAAEQLAAANETASEAERASEMEESEAESTASGSGPRKKRRKL